jgi:hypothetical protein
VTYSERPTAVPGVVLWQRFVGQEPRRTPILPDGCLDLLWDGERLFVAGPDATARWYQSPSRASYVALRCSGGTGPALLGVPAHELRDQTVGLERLLRLGRSLEAARAGAPLAQVAADCGYVDQAHLSRDVRDLTGSIPKRLLQELVRG